MLPFRDENPTTRTPYLTIALILVNVAVFFLVQPRSDSTIESQSESIEFSYEYAAVPCELVNGRPLSNGEISSALSGNEDGFAGDDTPACPIGIDAATCASEVFPQKNVYLSVLFSMFLHGSLLHLGGNMLYLWVFGNNIEDHLGPVKFLLFYVFAGAVATAAHVAVGLDSVIPMIGASGAVAGVMGAYLVWFPRARVTSLVFIMLIPIPAFIVLGFWFVSQFFIGPDEGVAWMAHVGGFVVGVLMALVVRKSPQARKAAWDDRYLGQPAGQEPRWDDRHGGTSPVDPSGSPWGNIETTRRTGGRFNR